LQEGVDDGAAYWAVAAGAADALAESLADVNKGRLGFGQVAAGAGLGVEILLDGLVGGVGAGEAEPSTILAGDSGQVLGRNLGAAGMKRGGVGGQPGAQVGTAELARVNGLGHGCQLGEAAGAESELTQLPGFATAAV
jgi:hypothetical protein